MTLDEIDVNTGADREVWGKGRRVGTMRTTW